MSAASKKRLLLGLLLTGFLIMSITGQSERLFGLAGLDSLSASNEAYLESASLRSMGMFGVLSTVKVGLAIIEGTEVGVGFGLQVGDVVQAAYDYVDVAWRTVLAGTVILFGTRYLLQAAALLDQWFLAITMFFALALVLAQLSSLPFTRMRRFIRDLLLLFSVVTVALYLILPLSVAGGAFLSHKITAPSVEEAESGIIEMRNELFSDIPYEGEVSISTIAGIKERMKNIIAYLKDRASRIVTWMFGLIAGYIFDCLIFPFLLFVLLLWLTKTGTNYLFGLERQRSLRDDIDGIMAKYFKQRGAADETKKVPDTE